MFLRETGISVTVYIQRQKLKLLKVYFTKVFHDIEGITSRKLRERYCDSTI